MKFKLVSLSILVLLIAGCSLADDVTPPPALATAQSAPVQLDATPARSQAQAVSEDPADLNPPEATPSLIKGAAIYADSCEPCHGPSGQGDGSMSGNLDVPIPPLGDFEFAREARPIDWYGVVTEGRMDRFMPPFSSLSDSQRWDVVAYALSLSYPTETRQAGAELYSEFCAACHGVNGEGTKSGSQLNMAEDFAERSQDAMIEIIQAGKGDMPAFGGSLSEEDQLLLAAYVQSLGTVVHGVTVDEPPTTESSESISLTGTISGMVVNATTGASLPDGLEVSIVALDGNVPVFEESSPVDEDGRYTLEGLEIQAGRIYGVLVEYQDVIYYSVGGHLLEEAPNLELPIDIFETTPDESSLIVDRLHLIFDFSVEGLVEVSELWLLSTNGDRTVVQPGGANVLPIPLPEEFSNLRFDNAISPDQFTVTEEGFLIHEPIRPGEPLEVVFSFTLPYTRSLNFNQPLNLPVQAVVLLADSDAPEIMGEGVQDLGELDMGGMILHNYAMDAQTTGEPLELTLRGAHPLAQTDLSSSNLAIGLSVFGVVLVGTGIAFWAWQRRTVDEQSVVSKNQQPVLNSGELLHSIATLDDAYEAGELEQEEYEQRRAVLKSQIMERMPDDD
jgi:mono/diheme cytochrome c family protein